jgi:hypothetical protein
VDPHLDHRLPAHFVLTPGGDVGLEDDLSRPDRLSIYNSEKEDKLRHQIHLSDLTAVAFLKDPKHKRQNVFGLFSPSRNFHLEAPNAQEAESWVRLIREQARIDEEEDEMFLASPPAQQPSGLRGMLTRSGRHPSEREMALSSSPEPRGIPVPNAAGGSDRRKSSHVEWSGLSGNEFMSQSDLSDNDLQRLPGASFESLTITPPQESRSTPTSGAGKFQQHPQPQMSRSLSHAGAVNVEQDPDRVIWQGWLYFLRTKGGVKQWKHLWGVLRPRNLILYKDGSEYTAQHIIRLSAIVNVVDIDPLSKSKAHCLQIITEEKSYRFAAHDEEALVQCIGAFKSLLAKRRELEARAAAAEQQRQQQQQQQQR